MLIFITSSNLPCLENESQTCLACLMGEKIARFPQNPHLQVRQVEVRCCICAPAKLGDKIPAKGTWNWNHHEIWRGGICWTSLIWENGGKFNRKKTSMFKHNLDFQKKIVHLLWERTLFPWKFPHFFGIFGVNPPSGPAHWPFQLEPTGTFQRSKNGRFFFDRKKSQVASAL